MNAKKDQNDVPVALAVSENDLETTEMLTVDPVTNYLQVVVKNSSNSATALTKDKIDQNFVKTCYGVSSADGTTLVPIRTDSAGFLLVDIL